LTVCTTLEAVEVSATYRFVPQLTLFIASLMSGRKAGLDRRHIAMEIDHDV